MEIKDTITIAIDFCDHPGARYIADGLWSGEQFLNEILYPKFKKAVEGNYLLLIDLDKVFGYPSSFVSGSFGKLSLLEGADKVLKYITFKSEENPLRLEIIVSEIREPNKKIK